METGILINLFLHVPFGLIRLAKVTSRQYLAVGVAKPFDKSVEQLFYRLYSRLPLFIVHTRSHRLMVSGAVAKEYSSSEEGTANRSTRLDRPRVADRSPLMRRRIQIFCFPQNLQCCFRSCITLCHEQHTFFPQIIQLFVCHLVLLYSTSLCDYYLFLCQILLVLPLQFIHQDRAFEISRNLGKAEVIGVRTL